LRLQLVEDRGELRDLFLVELEAVRHEPQRPSHTAVAAAVFHGEVALVILARLMMTAAAAVAGATTRSAFAAACWRGPALSFFPPVDAAWIHHCLRAPPGIRLERGLKPGRHAAGPGNCSYGEGTDNAGST